MSCHLAGHFIPGILFVLPAMKVSILIPSVCEGGTQAQVLAEGHSTGDGNQGIVRSCLPVQNRLNLSFLHH